MYVILLYDTVFEVYLFASTFTVSLIIILPKSDVAKLVQLFRVLALFHIFSIRRQQQNTKEHRHVVKFYNSRVSWKSRHHCGILTFTLFALLFFGRINLYFNGYNYLVHIVYDDF